MQQAIRTDQLISFHRNLPDYTSSPENSFQMAFGDRQYLKFTTELRTSDDVLKIKVLREINDCFRQPTAISLALLSSDLLETLLVHLENGDNEISELSSRAISQICKTSLGRDQVSTTLQGLERISYGLDDEASKIRENAYDALINYAETQDGKNRVLETRILLKLVEKLKREEEVNLIIKDLQLIRLLMEGEAAVKQVLQSTCTANLLLLLSHQSSLIRKLVISNLTAISFDDFGKSRVILRGGVMRISPFIEGDEQVVEAATICLCSLAQMNQGKDQMIAQGQEFFDQVIQLLDHRNDQIVLNSVQLLGSLAQHPTGRVRAQASLPKLRQLTQVDQEYLSSTIDIIQWQP